jgi:hypothetical protein
VFVRAFDGITDPQIEGASIARSGTAEWVKAAAKGDEVIVLGVPCGIADITLADRGSDG